jgi:hypothetical protein
MIIYIFSLFLCCSSIFQTFFTLWGSQTSNKPLQYKKLNILNPIRGGLQVKILSNEQLVFSYRDALKSGKEQESVVRILKAEITKRGLKPFKKKK